MIDELHLPKFSISTDYSLEDVLSKLGIREVFSTQADLSAITGTKDLRVSQVRQRRLGGSACALNVDGEGHEGMWDWHTCEKTYISQFFSRWGSLKPPDTPAESSTTLLPGYNHTQEPMMRKCLCLVLDHMGTDLCCTAGAPPLQSTAVTKHTQPQLLPSRTS